MKSACLSLLAILPSLLAASKGCNSITQLHIAGGQSSHSSMTVSFNSPNDCPSAVNYGLSPSSLNLQAVNTDGAKTYSAHSTQHGDYTSDYLHHVTLTGLQPATTYYYGVPTCSEYAPDCSVGDAVFSFTTAPPDGEGFPLNFAVVGDLGQTVNSLTTVAHIAADASVSAILHAGDMAYADCQQSRWDSYFSMIEFLATGMPWYVCPGNHEAEYDTATGAVFQAYEARFMMPQVKAVQTEPQAQPQECCPSEGNYTYNFGNAFYSFVYGPATVVFLNSYTDTAVDSPQYTWLQATLESVDRSVTPWVLVLFHCPFYNSFADHQGEAQQLLMKASFEDLFVQHDVNMVFTGHVHAYERTYNVVHETLDKKGPKYVLIGDGGNREGHASGYISESPPDWSAFRDNTIFGHGLLRLTNATHGAWEWHSNLAGDEFEISDSVVLENQFFL
jgi:hypothetical protein